MKLSSVLLVFVLVATAMLFVNAQQLIVQGINIDNCQMSGNTSCGGNMLVSCSVSTNAININSVEFAVADGSSYNIAVYSAKLLSGNNTNGTYGVNVTVGVNDQVVSSVYVRDSSDNLCGGTADVDVELCKVRFSRMTVASNCSVGSCYWTNTEECKPNDVVVKTYTPSAACGVPEYYVEGSCDYCTPDWVADTTVCVTNYSSSDPMVGMTSLKYVDKNDCYAKTGLESDNDPPRNDGGEVACRKDYWVQDGKDVSGSYGGNVSSAMTSELSILKDEYTGDYVALKPIVFDVDLDDLTDMVFITGSAINVYDTSMVLKRAVPILVGGGVSGFVRNEFALAGIDILDGGKTVNVDEDVDRLAGIGLSVVAVAKDAVNNTYVVAYRFENGDPVRTLNVNMAALGIEINGGLMCYSNYCYAISTQNNVVSINWKTGAVLKINPNAPDVVVSNSSVGKNQIPVGFSPTGGAVSQVVVLGEAEGVGGKVPAMFTCAVDLTSCSVNKIETGLTLSELSKLAVIGPASDGGYYTMFTTTEKVI